VYFHIFEKKQKLTIFTVWKTIFQKEWAIAKKLAAICTIETFGVELFANSIQTILNKINIVISMYF
jgi:hypothetical protein